MSCDINKMKSLICYALTAKKNCHCGIKKRKKIALGRIHLRPLTDPLWLNSSINFRTLKNHQKYQKFGKNEENPCPKITG